MDTPGSKIAPRLEKSISSLVVGIYLSDMTHVKYLFKCFIWFFTKYRLEKPKDYRTRCAAQFRELKNGFL
jgi:hypothetical protein